MLENNVQCHCDGETKNIRTIGILKNFFVRFLIFLISWISVVVLHQLCTISFVFCFWVYSFWDSSLKNSSNYWQLL